MVFGIFILQKSGKDMIDDNLRYKIDRGVF